MSAIDDLLDECNALYAFVAELDDAAWDKPTIFYGWTTHDEILHNHHLDLLAMQSITDPQGFTAIADYTAKQNADDPNFSFHGFTKATLATLGTPGRDQLLKQWRATYQAMCALFAARDPLERMAWFGPPMSVESCALARQMETWAHGQDIYDLFAVRRVNADRIGNIALLGVKTFGWSFLNRGLPVPPAKTYLELTAPSGAIWAYNDLASSNTITGPAEDFCMIVTQRRHVGDTQLIVKGDDAKAWLEIAQCFAGGPADGPHAGQRLITYADGTRG